MKPALGKGLSALIPDKQKKAAANELMELDIKSIKPNEYQPRRVFKDSALNDLVASIKEKGVIQPIIVRRRKSESGDYQIISGERRWRACQKAGLKEISVIVKIA